MNLRFSSFAALAVLAGCYVPPPAAEQQPTGGSAGTGAVASGGQGGIGTGGTAGLGTGGAIGGGGLGTGGAIGGGGLGGQSGGFAGGGWGGGGFGGSTGGIGGAGTNAGGAAGIPPTFDTLKLILTGTNPPCVASDCHGLKTENKLELAVNERLYSTLTTHVSMACGNIPVVTPGDPQRSALIMLLKGPCGMTPRMPRGCVEDQFDNTCVPNEYIAAIEQWVRNGAPP